MARKKGGGGKLNRSEIIQARLDPKLHLAAEIMARTERRTLSSFIEKSIEQAAQNNTVKRNLKFLWWLEGSEKFYVGRQTSDEVSVEKAVHDIGTDHESIRFMKFAMYFHYLLTNEERQRFNNIILTPYFWLHYPYRVEDVKGKLLKTAWSQVDAIEGLDRDNLCEYWERLKTNKVDFNELCNLPMGRKISGPLKEDVNAISKKIIKGKSFEIIYAWQNNEVDLTDEEKFWQQHSNKLVTKKIKIIRTNEGMQIVKTLVPSSNAEDQKIWNEFVQKKIEEQKHGT